MTHEATLADVLSTLASITIEQIDAALATIDQQIDEAMKPLKARRAQLVSLKRMKSGSVMGRAKPAKKMAVKSVRTQELSLANEVHAFLTAAGPSKVQVIADQVGREYQTIYSCLSSRVDLFCKTGTAEFGVK